MTFITYRLTGHSLTPAIIFSGLQYFNVLKTPTAFLPMCFTAISDALVGIERIGALLRAEEMPEGVNVQVDASWAVNVKGDSEFEKVSGSKKENGTAETKKEQAKIEKKSFRLENIDLRIPKGDYGFRQRFHLQLTGKAGDLVSLSVELGRESRFCSLV